MIDVYLMIGTVPQTEGRLFNRKFENSSQSLSGRRLWGEFSNFHPYSWGPGGVAPWPRIRCVGTARLFWVLFWSQKSTARGSEWYKR